MKLHKRFNALIKMVMLIVTVSIFVTISFGQGSVGQNGSVELAVGQQLPRLSIFTATSKYNEASENKAISLSSLRVPASNMEVAANLEFNERLGQVLDVVKEKQSLLDGAKKLKISESEMKAMYSRFMAKGKPGLMTPTKSNLQDFVDRFKGRWAMQSRVVGGLRSATESEMYFDIHLSPDETKILGHVLVLETGRFDSKICKLGPGEVDGEPFVMAAIMKVEAMVMMDGSVMWNFDGEIQGSYGSYRNGLKFPKMSTQYFRFAESYTAIAPVEDDPKTLEIEIKDTDFSDIYVEGERMVMKSTGFDTIDSYQRVTKEARSIQGIWSLPEYFLILKASGALQKPPAFWELLKTAPPKERADDGTTIKK